MARTNRNLTLTFKAPWPITIPAGTVLVHVPHNAGMAVPQPYAVASVDDLVRAGADRFTAQHYWCWVPNDAVSAD